MIVLTSTAAESDTAVLPDVAKVAVSDGLLGTVAGVQFVGVFQSPFGGLARHFALPAGAICAKRNELNVIARIESGRNFIRPIKKEIGGESKQNRSVSAMG